MHEQTVADTAVEQEELRRIRQEVADFKAKLLATYREHLTLIGILDGNVEEKDEPEPVAETKVEEQPVVAPVEDIPVIHAMSHDMPDFSALELIDED